MMNTNKSETEKRSAERDDLPADGGESHVTLSAATRLSLISINAALYAVAIAVTSPIPTPWGVGHFRPGVVIPAFFTVVFGPIVGGVGAAIGCFLGDFALSFFGLTTPLLSLIAGVPGNFVGFYVLGWLISKRRSVASFIISSFIGLIVGNLIAALGVLAYFWFVVPEWVSWPLSMKISVVSGLTLFWVVTMVIFVVPLVPIIVGYVEPSLKRMGFKATSNLVWSSSLSPIKSSAVIALFLVAIYCIVTISPGGGMIFAGVLPPEILLIGSAVVLASGIVFAHLTKKAARFFTSK